MNNSNNNSGKNFNGTDLLDAFTKLLAYLGDENTELNGYENVVPRNPELSPKEISDLLPIIMSAIAAKETNAGAALDKIKEEDIRNKVKDIIMLSKQFPGQKDELIEHIEEFIIPQINSEVFQSGLKGGAKKSSKKRKTVTRKKARRVNRKKSRSRK